MKPHVQMVRACCVKLLCKQFSRAAEKPAFSAPGFWSLSQQQETPKQQVDPVGEQCCSRLAVSSPNPVPWALPKLQTVSFLPDKPQGFLTDWSQFWKGRDISNFADFRLGGCCGLWAASSLLGRACVRVCVCPMCACLFDHR